MLHHIHSVDWENLVLDEIVREGRHRLPWYGHVHCRDRGRKNWGCLEKKVFGYSQRGCGMEIEMVG